MVLLALLCDFETHKAWQWEARNSSNRPEVLMYFRTKIIIFSCLKRNKFGKFLSKSDSNNTSRSQTQSNNQNYKSYINSKHDTRLNITNMSKYDKNFYQ